MKNIIENCISEQEIAYFRQKAVDNEVEDLIPYVEHLLKRKIFVAYGKQENYRQIGNSRLGGWPDTPPDFEWPRCPSGKYLQFVFQLNLADIAPMQQILPTQGLLQFFLGGHLEKPLEIGVIRFFPEVTPNFQPFKLPQPLELNDFSWGFWGAPGDEWFKTEANAPMLTDKAYRANFLSALSLPSKDSHFFADELGQQFLSTLDDREMLYLDWQDDLFTALDFDGNDITPSNYHSLLGYVEQAARSGDPHTMGDWSGPPSGTLLFTSNPIHYQGFYHGWLGAIEASYDFIVPTQKLKQLDFSQVYVSGE